MISVFRPTTLFILLTYLILFYFALTFQTTIDIKYVFHFGLLLLSIMFASIISAKLTFKDNLPHMLSYFDENGNEKVNIIYNEFNFSNPNV